MGLEWLDPTLVWCVMRNPQGLHRLSTTGVKHASKPGWYSDGGGLYLEVDKTGRKRWAMRLVVAGKRRDFGLGPIHKVSLLQARERAADYRAKAYAGIDPAAERRAQTKKRVEPARKVLTFEDAANETHQSRKLMWSNGKHVSQWLHSLRDYAYPLIGAKPVNTIGTPDIMAVLTPIWTTKPETARRVRQRLKAVLEWARAAGHRSGDNPVDAIGAALPKHTRNPSHHDALPYTEVAQFICDLLAGHGEVITKLAFEFLILTAVRTSEVRFATWDEIDFDTSLWTIPAERMKARRPHIVPLPARAVAILRKVEKLPAVHNVRNLVFVDPKNGQALSENRFLVARDALDYRNRCTPHGFRSSFRDWAAEETTTPNEVVEMALAHAIKSKAEAAYRRGDLIAKRRTLMEAWADYVHR